MRYERYLNGVLVESVDTRTVSKTAALQIDYIKQSCKSAIEQTGITWMLERELSGGKAVPESIKEQCQFYRNLNNNLEQQIKELVNTTADNNDKSICDKIEKIVWTI